MSIGEKMERDQDFGLGNAEYYRKRAEEEARQRQLESARRGVTIGALEERVGQLEGAYGAFGTHNETHIHVNKRLEALERVAGEPLYGDKPGNKFFVDGHEVKTKLEEQIVKHIIKQNKRIEELETMRSQSDRMWNETIPNLIARVSKIEDPDRVRVNTKHWGVTDGQPDPTVQLRRDVGKLVAAARTARRALNVFGNTPTQIHAIGVIDEALALFAGDYE